MAENKKVTSLSGGSLAAFLLSFSLFALVIGSTGAEWFFNKKESNK